MALVLFSLAKRKAKRIKNEINQQKPSETNLTPETFETKTKKQKKANYSWAQEGFLFLTILCYDGDDCRDFVKIWIWDLVSFAFFAGHVFVLCFSKVIREFSSFLHQG